jgi:Tfp pilus assembly protein PilO
MTTPMKLIIAILAMLLIGAGFYMFDWSEKWERRKTAEGQLQQKRDELAALEEAIKELPKLQQQVAERQRQMQELVGGMNEGTGETPDQFVGNYLEEVERLVADQQKNTGDYGFIIKSVSPGQVGTAAPQTGAASGGSAPPAPAQETPEALSAFQTRVFSMSMEGRYATIVDFLYQLGSMKMNRLVTINSVRLARSGEAGGASPTLTIEMPITAYLKAGTN